MGINFNKINGVNSIYKNQKVDAKKGILDASKVSGKKDELNISKEAMDFSTVMKSVKVINSLPDVREDVIAPIKDKLEKGTYDVDGSKIAEKMLKSNKSFKI